MSRAAGIAAYALNRWPDLKDRALTNEEAATVAKNKRQAFPGMTRHEIRQAVTAATGQLTDQAETPTKLRPPSKSKKKMAFSREQFVSEFDADTKTRQAIRAGLAQLEDEIVPDAAFRQDYCENAATAGWRAVCGEHEFHGHRLAVSSSIFWGSKESVKWALQNVHNAKAIK